MKASTPTSAVGENRLRSLRLRPITTPGLACVQPPMARPGCNPCLVRKFCQWRPRMEPFAGAGLPLRSGPPEHYYSARSRPERDTALTVIVDDVGRWCPTRSVGSRVGGELTQILAVDPQV